MRSMVSNCWRCHIRKNIWAFEQCWMLWKKIWLIKCNELKRAEQISTRLIDVRNDCWRLVAWDMPSSREKLSSKSNGVIPIGYESSFNSAEIPTGQYDVLAKRRNPRAILRLESQTRDDAFLGDALPRRFVQNRNGERYFSITANQIRLVDALDPGLKFWLHGRLGWHRSFSYEVEQYGMTNAGGELCWGGGDVWGSGRAVWRWQGMSNPPEKGAAVSAQTGGQLVCLWSLLRTMNELVWGPISKSKLIPEPESSESLKNHMAAWLGSIPSATLGRVLHLLGPSCCVLCNRGSAFPRNPTRDSRAWKISSCAPRNAIPTSNNPHPKTEKTNRTLARQT